MAEYITKIRTESGDKQIDYNALANLPTSDTTLSVPGMFADAEAVGKDISDLTKSTDDKIANLSSEINSSISQLSAELNNKIDQSNDGMTEYVDSLNDAVTEKIDELNDLKFDKSGGTIDGEISMSNNNITNLAEPVNSADATTKNYVDSKHFVTTATIGTAWSGQDVPYLQIVSVPDILEEDNPHISPMYSDVLDTAIEQKEAWMMVNRGVTSDGEITFYCFEYKPEVKIPIKIEVHR